MTTYQLFAIERDGPRPLPAPSPAITFNDLVAGLTLGVYAALRTFEHNKFLFLDRHLARTQRSMQLLGWTYQLDERRLRAALHEVVTNYPLADARVRFDVLAAPAASLGTDSREIVAVIPFVPYPTQIYECGVKVDFAPDLHREDPLAKTADFAVARSRYDTTGDIHEYLLLNQAGAILEGTNSNFYGVRDGHLVTAGVGILEGITRRIVLEQARGLGIPVVLEPIGRNELGSLDEAAISSSSRGLVPVINVAGQTIGAGWPGPICGEIVRAYNSFIQQEIRTAMVPNERI